MTLHAHNPCCRRAQVGAYELSAAWAYLAKHIPCVTINTTTGAATTSKLAVLPSSQQQQGSSAQWPSVQETQQGIGGAQQQLLLLPDLMSAIRLTRPSPPRWSFAPVRVVAVVGQGGGGSAALRAAVFYDVKLTLVQKRCAGERVGWAQIHVCPVSQTPKLGCSSLSSRLFFFLISPSRHSPVPLSPILQYLPCPAPFLPCIFPPSPLIKAQSVPGYLPEFC